MNVKMSEGNYDEKQNTIILKVPLHKILITKGKTVTLRWSNLANTKHRLNQLI